MANFNFTNKNEYALHTSLIEEVINLYGIQTKFLVVEEINQDPVVFGDFSHLKTDNSKIFEIYMLPEETEDWDSGGYNMNEFGTTNFDNIALFAAKSSFDEIFPDDFKLIMGNLIVLPNQKIMEITSVEVSEPGINNLFTENDAKSVFKLSVIPHSNKLINEIDNIDIAVDEEVPYEGLDHYFEELGVQKDEQDIEMTVTATVDTVDISGAEDVVVQKPIVDETEEDPWGDFA